MIEPRFCSYARSEHGGDDGTSCLLMAYLAIAMSADDGNQIIMIAITRSS
jgi:hypothetical protein